MVSAAGISSNPGQFAFGAPPEDAATQPKLVIGKISLVAEWIRIATDTADFPHARDIFGCLVDLQ